MDYTNLYYTFIFKHLIKYYIYIQWNVGFQLNSFLKAVREPESWKTEPIFPIGITFSSLFRSHGGLWKKKHKRNQTTALCV